MRHAALALAWASVLVAVVAFFLPWARIDLREPEIAKQLRQTAPGQSLVEGLTKKIGKVVVQVKRGTETVTGELPSLEDIPKRVSGVQIPQLANQKNAQVVMALAELLTNERRHAGAKSYAVYLVPGLALLCGVLLTARGRRRGLALGVALLCAAVAAVGFWKLSTTNTTTRFIAITIGPGLRLSLLAYAGLAVAAVLFAKIDTTSRRSL